MSSFHLNIKSSKTERESWTFLAADEDWCLTVGLAVHSNKQPDGTFCAHPSPSLTFPPNSDTCQILTSDWRISNQAANQRAGLQIRPPSDEGRCGTIMVMLSSKKVSECDSGNICHTIIQRPREREREEQQILVTVSFYLCCKLWEDNNGVNVVKILIRSRPIIFIVPGIEDWGLTLSHGPMLTEDERWERCWYVFVISYYLGSAEVSGLCIYVEMVHKVSCVTRDARDM